MSEHPKKHKKKIKKDVSFHDKHRSLLTQYCKLCWKNVNNNYTGGESGGYLLDLVPALPHAVEQVDDQVVLSTVPHLVFYSDFPIIAASE